MTESTVASNFSLPPMPSTATQLVSVLNSSDVKVAEVVQLIEYEPAISARVLQMVNSPLYAVSRPITTIGHGIVILGFKNVSQLALAVASQALFDGDARVCQQARLATYEQSLGVATVARQIARVTRLVAPDEAFLCGILHDVGKLVLFNEYAQIYEKVVQASESIDSTATEIERFGTSHPDLGSQCCRTWELPQRLSTGIKNHHADLDEQLDPLSQVTIMSAQIAASWGYGFKSERELSEQVVQRIGELEVDQLKSECSDQFNAIREICGVTH